MWASISEKVVPLFAKNQFLTCLRFFNSTVYTRHIISVNCQWSSWGQYSKCTKSSGGGTQSKTRSKIIPESGGGTCFGENEVFRSCNLQCHVSNGYQTLDKLNQNQNNSKQCNSRHSACFAFTGNNSTISKMNTEFNLYDFS